MGTKIVNEDVEEETSNGDSAGVYELSVEEFESRKPTSKVSSCCCEEHSTDASHRIWGEGVIGNSHKSDPSVARCCKEHNPWKKPGKFRLLWLGFWWWVFKKTSDRDEQTQGSLDYLQAEGHEESPRCPLEDSHLARAKEEKMSEILKCDYICANCHRIRTKERFDAIM